MFLLVSLSSTRTQARIRTVKNRRAPHIRIRTCLRATVPKSGKTAGERAFPRNLIYRFSSAIFVEIKSIHLWSENKINNQIYYLIGLSEGNFSLYLITWRTTITMNYANTSAWEKKIGLVILSFTSNFTSIVCMWYLKTYNV